MFQEKKEHSAHHHPDHHLHGQVLEQGDAVQLLWSEEVLHLAATLALAGWSGTGHILQKCTLLLLRHYNFSFNQNCQKMTAINRNGTMLIMILRSLVSTSPTSSWRRWEASSTTSTSKRRLLRRGRLPIKMKFQAVADKNYPHALLAGAARRDGARAHVRGGLPLGGGHHPPWRHLVLRRRQRRPHRAQVETRALSFLATRCSSPETALTCWCQSWQGSSQDWRPLQRSHNPLKNRILISQRSLKTKLSTGSSGLALSWLHPPPAGTIDHGGQKGDSLAPGDPPLLMFWWKGAHFYCINMKTLKTAQCHGSFGVSVLSVMRQQVCLFFVTFKTKARF